MKIGNFSIRLICLSSFIFFFSCQNDIDGVYVLDKEHFKAEANKKMSEGMDENATGFEALASTMATAMIDNMDMTLGIKGDSIFILGNELIDTFSDDGLAFYETVFTVEGNTISYSGQGGEVTLTIDGNGLSMPGGGFDLFFIKSNEDKDFYSRVKDAKNERDERLEKLAILNSSIEVELLEKSHYEYKYREYLMFDFIFRNLSDREITAFSGSFKISNLLDDEVKSINITYDDPIPPKSDVKWTGQINYSDYDHNEAQLKTKELSKFKMLFTPDAILFSDGEKVQLGN